jgi:hypothetical protein
LKIPRFCKRNIFNGEHYWEVGKHGLGKKKLKKDIMNCGWEIEKFYTVKGSPVHLMIVLKK